MCSNDTRSHIFASRYPRPGTTNVSRTETIDVPPTLRTPVPLRRSNIPDIHGFHDWAEYQLQPIHTTPFLHPSTLYLGLTDAFVDITAIVTSFPRDLCLRWVFQDPCSSNAKVLYGRDTELRWTEIVAGARSGIVPARYVTRIAPDATLRGPMTREWFLDMVSQFSVSKEGKLQRDGLDVVQIWEDFEWTATAMLLTVKNVDLTLYTPERLVKDVRETFHVWHIDSMNRASALISQFNSSSPLSTTIPQFFQRIAPPPYSYSDDSLMDFEVEI
ncbi:hypothetical protein F5050DRAFT_1813056 [Lentinula boryana]|uniref:Uncharacterized protein n=1 Tax=Lentinula boryana TaxID=40481 RepID=A0ABQ8PXE7_9AGAR|nr:hypothetical protein F5050DRAFT_1813056 [Lentinula boryana]